MSQPTIPPPSDLAMGYNLANEWEHFESGAFSQSGYASFIVGLICRCHAAEQQLSRIRDLVRERLGKEPCPSCNGRGYLVPPAVSHDDDDKGCGRCGGTGYLADTLPSVVDAVERMLRELEART